MKFVILIFIFTISLFGIENTMGTAGYVRLQTILDGDKANVCFKAPGAGSKYRLGNECETWLELGVFQNLKFENDIVIRNEVRPVFSAPNNEKIEFIRFDEAYSEISNLFDNSVSFWIGRRFYKRYDSYLSDYFFLNMSGDGFGVNNLDLGFSKASYSFMFNEVDPDIVSGDATSFFQSHDLRFENSVDRGVATLFLNYMRLQGKRFNATQSLEEVDGYALGLLFKDKKITKELFGLEGENITGLFYGQGLAKGAGAYSPYLQESLVNDVMNAGDSINSSQTLRFINYNAFENETFGVMSNFVYEYKDDKKFSSIEQDWLSFGVRPYYFFNKYSRFLLELGYDMVANRVADETYSLIKATTALEFSFEKGIWKKPVLRIFYTNATWSENSKGRVGTSYYENQTSGDNAGVQLEYWW
mgnify:CR=1 FL=1